MNLQINWVGLDESLYSHYFLCHYMPSSSGKDTLSHRILRFKRGYQPELDHWIQYTLRSISAAALPEGLTIIRALHHEETRVPADGRLPLDILAENLAKFLDADYRPQLLRKSHPCRAVKELSVPERESELQHLYYMVQPPPDTPILILDDVLTTGTTMKGIIRALLAAHKPLPAPAAREPSREPVPDLVLRPAPFITIFTLAKAAC
jgi:predicted amidophosphoribosyltransferase